MTQKDKELLLKDLSARLPYGVKILADGRITDIASIKSDGTIFVESETQYEDGMTFYSKAIEAIPYLRPMSSMTGAEKSELELMGFRYENGSIINEDATEYDDYRNHPYTWVDEARCSEIMEFLNSKHFDYMGLIEKGLALEAQEDMYKFE